MPLLTTTRVPADFAETTAPGNGITINYVRGGTGPTLVLLHGYPQTWYMWRKVLPAGCAHLHPFAADLRGAGGAGPPTPRHTKIHHALDNHHPLVGAGLAGPVRALRHHI